LVRSISRKAIPERIDPERIIFIKRAYVDPPAREESAPPEAPQEEGLEEAAGNLFGAESKRRVRRIEYPNISAVLSIPSIKADGGRATMALCLAPRGGIMEGTGAE
jgi:hypothetical protein